MAPPMAIEPAAMPIVRGEPDATPWPSKAYGVVRSSAPMAIAAVKAPGRTGEIPAA